MSFDELPSDAAPPRLENGDKGASDRETSPSDAPPATPSRRRASRAGSDAASTEPTGAGESPARSPRRRRAPLDEGIKIDGMKTDEAIKTPEPGTVAKAAPSNSTGSTSSTGPLVSTEGTGSDQNPPAQKSKAKTKKTDEAAPPARRRLAANKAESGAEPEVPARASTPPEVQATRRARRSKPVSADEAAVETLGTPGDIPVSPAVPEPTVPVSETASPETAKTSRRRSVRAPKDASVAANTAQVLDAQEIDVASANETYTAETVTQTVAETPSTAELSQASAIETDITEITAATEETVGAITEGQAEAAPGGDDQSAVLPGLPARRTRSRSGRNRRRQGVDTETGEGVDVNTSGVEASNGTSETPALPLNASARGTTETDAKQHSRTNAGESAGEGSGESERDAEPRGRRRNRRNNRSRNETSIADAVEAVSAADSENDSSDPDMADLIAEAVVAPPAFVAPVIEIEEPIELTVGAHLIIQNGVPRIHIDNRPFPPVFFFGNMEGGKNTQRVLSEVRQAAKAGVHLHSTLVELPCPLSEANYVLDDIDTRLRALLDADPDGYVMPRLVFVPARGWKREYPTDISTYSDGTNGDPSLTSTRFWQEAERALEVLITHVGTQTYGERVFGYHLERGEWFQPADLGYDRSMANRDAFRDWLREKYKNSLILLRAAWYDGDVQFHTAEIPPVPGKPNPQRAFYETRRERSIIDFNEFTSESTANRLASLGRAVKKASHSNALVSVCYGYTFEFGHNFSGHLALDRLLASPHIDLICGPPSYRDRKPTGASSFPAPVDSPILHGKLWISEDDTKTFLAPVAQDPEDFNPRLNDRFATEQAQARAMGRALATNTGIGWMDLWGEGWLDDENMWERISAFTERIDRQQSEATTSPAPDVVILIDEKSLLHVQKGELFLRRLTNGLRDTLQRSGASYSLYLQSDLLTAEFPLDARLYLFLTPYRLTSEQRAFIKEKLQRDNKTLAWLYAPGACEVRPTSGMEEVATGTVGLTLRQQAWNSEIGSRILDPNHILTERLQGRELGTRERLNPSFYVDDPGATVLAEYQSSGLASIAVRNFGTWKSVFIGDPVLPLELLRGICRYAGVTLYAPAGEDVVTVGNGWITVHAVRDGQRTLRLATSQAIYDMHERRVMAEDTREYRYFLRAGMTRVFCVGTRERFALLNLPNADVSQRSRPTSERDENKADNRTDNRAENEVEGETRLSRGFESENPKEPGRDEIRRENGRENDREVAHSRQDPKNAPDNTAQEKVTFSRIFPKTGTDEGRMPTRRNVYKENASRENTAGDNGSQKAEAEELEPETVMEPFPEPRRVPTARPTTIVNPSLRADLETLKAVLEMQMPDEDEDDAVGTAKVTPPLPLPKEGLPGLEAVLGVESLGRRRRRRGGRGRGRRPLNGAEEGGDSTPDSESAPDTQSGEEI